MREPSANQVREKQWAEAHFREYLLGLLTPDEDERLTTAVALTPGLVDDLEEAEEDLIETYLDGGLAGDDRQRFEAQYIQGPDLENRAKLRLHRELRSPQHRRELKLEPDRPARAPRAGIWAWRLLAVAASAMAIVFGVLLAQQSRQLATALAALRNRPAPAPLRGPEAPRKEQAKSNPNDRRTPEEQPAGSNPSEGILLPQASGTATVQIAVPPVRLIWAVPDYRHQYRFRIYTSSGRELTSPALTPRDNAVEYSPDNPRELILPWDVFVLGPAGTDERVLVHYILTRE